MHRILLSKQFASFLVVGAIATLVHFGLMIGLRENFGWNPVAATLIGFLGGMTVSYLLNKRHTFSQSNRPHSEAFWRFFTVSGTGFTLTLLMSLLLMSYLRIPYILAQCVTTGTILMWNFLANRFWTFRI